MKEFDIPVVLFLFKRVKKTVQIVEQIKKVRPSKLYLIGDGPRNDNESLDVLECRREVEKHIDWDCEVIRNYAERNRGVYQNIAGGALWVFEHEAKAIFLEDDNLPAISFFQYCKELLERYETDTRVLWICGTNYLKEYMPQDGSDYVFTKLMLPCGWASWSSKFTKFYDGTIQLYRNPYIRERLRKEYLNKLLYQHDFPAWERIIEAINNGKQPSSWDYQMALALRLNNVYGIAPKYNLICNIGADMDSIHGGVSMDNIMTRRFCEVPFKEMAFPLKHPQALLVDYGFEKRTEKVIVLPLQYRLKGFVVKVLKSLLGIDSKESLSYKLKFWK